MAWLLLSLLKWFVSCVGQLTQFANFFPCEKVSSVEEVVTLCIKPQQGVVLCSCGQSIIKKAWAYFLCPFHKCLCKLVNVLLLPNELGMLT